MTEEEWLTTDNPERLVRHCQKDLGNRKERLIAVAMCRWIEGLVPAQESARLIELVEAFADGETSQDELEEAARIAARHEARHARNPALAEARRFAAAAVTFAAGRVTPALWALQSAAAAVRQMKLDPVAVSFAELVRDIAGNPFHHITLDPHWKSSTVLDLAHTIYRERVFERVPILGDALMDAGCDSDDIIQHCQRPGPHVRGCWVVDLILGKT